jgi:hypothetical protein
MFRRVCAVVGVLVVSSLAVTGLASARTIGPVSPSPTAAAVATSTSVSVLSDGLHLPGESITVVASLKPDAAYGDISLYDGGTLLATGDSYRIRWTYATSTLAIGTHRLTVDFTPAAGTGYAPSTGSVDYVVDGPAAPAPSPTPAVTPTRPASPKPAHSPSSTPRPHPSTTDTQVAVGVVPTPTPTVVVSAGGGTRTASPVTTSTPSTSASPVPSVLAGGGTPGATSGKGSLPFTGFNAARLVDLALALFCLGMMLLFVARLRRARRSRTGTAD